MQECRKDRARSLNKIPQWLFLLLMLSSYVDMIFLFVLVGRGYPDVSAYGTHFFTVNDGEVQPAAGTSASVPVMAAIIAMCQYNAINDIEQISRRRRQRASY